MTARKQRIFPTHWDVVEAALTCVPESHPLRAQGLAAFDHLKERVTGQGLVIHAEHCGCKRCEEFAAAGSSR